MRILLVAPHADSLAVTPAWLRIPQMSLLILEALSGNGHQVVTVEDQWDPGLLTEKWDLVGISVMTATAPRAYALAKRFRERGAQVILGGIHASVLPEEAGRHADAVLVGEAEALWDRILEDAEHRRLEPVYYNLKPEKIPVPLVNYKNGRESRAPTLSPVISSRGCPHRCDFCSVPRIYGNRLRNLPVEQVVEQVKRSPGGYVAFLDDNLGAGREYALELFTALKDLQRKIIGQVSVKFILDQELFQLAVAAGLKGIFVGFESIEKESLERFRKSVALEEAGLAVRKCRAAGVILNGSFIFGLDEHDATIFGRTLDFIMEHKIPSVTTYVLTPYPGTPLFDRLSAEGRLLHRNWAFYDHFTPVYQPARMTIKELIEGYLKFRASLYSFTGIARRLLPWVAVNPYAYYHLNASLRRTTPWLREHYQGYFSWLKDYHPEIC
jgi:radical SAM superfamily enzyme YgiQ (UPF0313 family)